MTQELKVTPRFFDNDNMEAVTIMRRHLESQHAYIMTEAKAKLREAVRTRFCEMFGVKREEQRDDEGGGSIGLEFPEGWTEDQATAFAEQCLDMDCSYRYGGPGRYFQSGGIWTNPNTNRVAISMYWGLDI